GRSQLDVLAVGRGPGAFTGVRLGIAIIQGLALALDRPVVPVSTLAVLAMRAPAQAREILAAIDARMGEVYLGAFRRSEDGLVQADGPELVLPPALAPLPAGEVHGVGTGFGAEGGMLAQRFGKRLVSLDAQALPHAGDLARLAAAAHARGEAVPAEQVEPAYLRDKDALTLAEQGKPLPRASAPIRSLPSARHGAATAGSIRPRDSGAMIRSPGAAGSTQAISSISACGEGWPSTSTRKTSARTRRPGSLTATSSNSPRRRASPRRPTPISSASSRARVVMASSPGSRLPPGWMKVGVPRLRTSSTRPPASRMTAATVRISGLSISPPAPGWPGRGSRRSPSRRSPWSGRWRWPGPDRSPGA